MIRFATRSPSEGDIDCRQQQRDNRLNWRDDRELRGAKVLAVIRPETFRLSNWGNWWILFLGSTARRRRDDVAEWVVGRSDGREWDCDWGMATAQSFAVHNKRLSSEDLILSMLRDYAKIEAFDCNLDVAGWPPNNQQLNNRWAIKEREFGA